MAEGLTDQALRQIVAKAQLNNRRLDVTGVLAVAPATFAQVLEGDADSVEATLQRIRQDERHSDLVLLLDDAAKVRYFDRWSMALLVDELSASLALDARSSNDGPRALLERLRQQHEEDPHCWPPAMRGMSLGA